MKLFKLVLAVFIPLLLFSCDNDDDIRVLRGQQTPVITQPIPVIRVNDDPYYRRPVLNINAGYRDYNYDDGYNNNRRTTVVNKTVVNKTIVNKTVKPTVNSKANTIVKKPVVAPKTVVKKPTSKQISKDYFKNSKRKSAVRSRKTTRSPSRVKSSSRSRSSSSRSRSSSRRR